MRHFFSVIICLFVFSNLISQSDTVSTKTKKRKGTFYLSWGYTRADYSRSDIRFVDRSNKYHPATGMNHNYDFTVYDVKATDRNDFHQITDIENFTIPQYAYRFGYYFNNKADIGIEINFDHTKYIAIDDQVVRISGDINGVWVDKDTLLKNVLHFEHSDGANFLLLNFVKRWKLIKSSPNFTGSWIAKGGLGVVIPKTDITLFGERLNNKFNVAGWMAGIETGIRAEIYKYTFIEFVGKASYADYLNTLVLGAGNGKASHHFFAIQATATLGFQFPFLNLK